MQNIKTIAICTPMAGIPDWALHQRRLMEQAYLLFGNVEIHCAITNIERSEYNGTNGRECGLENIKRADLCVFGIGWRDYEGCVMEHNEARRLQKTIAEEQENGDWLEIAYF